METHLIPRLDEFTVEELEYALVEILDGIEYIDKFSTKSKKYEALCLWRTQILNAISTVKMRETTQAN